MHLLCTLGRSGWFIVKYVLMSTWKNIWAFIFISLSHVSIYHLFKRVSGWSVRLCICLYVHAAVWVGMLEWLLPLPWGVWMWVKKHLHTLQKCLPALTPHPPSNVKFANQNANPQKIKFSAALSIIQHLDRVQLFLCTRKHVNVQRRLFLLHFHFYRGFKSTGSQPLSHCKIHHYVNSI